MLSGILESSKMVPTVALNCRLQARHLNRRDTMILGTGAPDDAVRFALAALRAYRAVRPAGRHQMLAALLRGELHHVQQGEVGEVQHGRHPTIYLPV